MFRNIVKKVFGDPMEKALSVYQESVNQINALESSMQALSDEQMKAKTAEFKAQLEGGARFEDIMIEAFALVREASVRTIGLRHYDVQLIGGIVLHEGRIAEMKTGEGKTLVATLPLYLNALDERGAHLVTPNDYLSKHGLQFMGPIYHLLGLSAAVIQNTGGGPDSGSFLFDPDFISDDARYQNLRPISRRDAYQADILYGTNNEFGFDYLRDNMVLAHERLVQRELRYAIVDEVDNILIDEARTPLIISGPSDEPSDFYRRFASIVKRLKKSSEDSVEAEEPDGDFVLDIGDRIVYLTEGGVEKVEKALGVHQLYHPDNAEMLPYLDNCLRAQTLYQNDKEYIVQNGEVVIVDDFTGRLMPGRRFSEGLHQAIEAKEGVQIRRENITMATITFQNFFRMYDKLAGMTGTALTEAEEFEKTYELDVVPIPTHQPVIRADENDLIYVNETSKWNAIVQAIQERNERNQPILVGTVAVETSERLSKYLSQAGIKHEVLNAKQHEKEAEIITQAGRPGAVTIATNMAGRGVDILLGGNPEGLARGALRRSGIDLTAATDAQWRKAQAEAEKLVLRDREVVLEAGGLFVLGTERHEARRIDNQLRGRSGRQGDPGESRFYLSLDDDLMKRFANDNVKRLMKTAGFPEDEAIQHSMISKSIEQAQIRVEGHNFDIRKRVVEYDDVVNRQREIIYGQRLDWLQKDAEQLHRDFLVMIEDQIAAAVEDAFAADHQGEHLEAGAMYQQLASTGLPLPETITAEALEELEQDDVTTQIRARAADLLAAKKEQLEAAREGLTEIAERQTVIRALDHFWQRHLTDLDILREGIGLQAIAQKDPLVEYQRQGFQMFRVVEDTYRQIAARQIFLVQPAVVQTPQRRREMREYRPDLQMGNTDRPTQQTVRRNSKRPGRNKPCWCGSGKKYKHCHMREDNLSGKFQQAG
ncbi:MAG: preprotein translocase subunit SecA [Chloroflexota bacterium]|nr:preprotein translocase subunit SecA [Chloroflexota bacterium]